LTKRIPPLVAIALGVLIGAGSMLLMGSVPTLAGACASFFVFACAEMVLSPRYYEHVASFAPPGREGSIARAVRDAASQLDAGVRIHVSRFEADGAVVFFTFADAAGEVIAGDALAAIRTAAETAAEKAGGILLGTSPEGLETYERELKRLLDPHGVFDLELDS